MNPAEVGTRFGIFLVMKYLIAVWANEIIAIWWYFLIDWLIDWKNALIGFLKKIAV